MDSGGLTPGLRSPHFTPNSITSPEASCRYQPQESVTHCRDPSSLGHSQEPGGQARPGWKTRSPGQPVGMWTAGPEAVGRQRGVQEAPPWHLEAPSHTWHQPCTGLPCALHTALWAFQEPLFFSVWDLGQLVEHTLPPRSPAIL